MDFASYFLKRKNLKTVFFILSLISILPANNLYCQDTSASDWPLFRRDAQRSGTTPLKLSDQMQLKWTREFKPLETAWPDDTRIQFDKSYHPIVVGKSLFIASSNNDCLYSISTETGEIQWKFFADAPIRFAPASKKGKIYFVSDDSYLYCLDAKSGKLIWRYRGAPNDSKILVNGRLASPWPARGAPVVDDNKVYFSAGIWPFMGVFIYALDIETGKVVWVNSGSDSSYLTQTHDSKAFTGPAPQGYMTLVRDTLLIPNGRSLPAAYSKNSGELLYYHLPQKAGGYYTSATEQFFFFSNMAYHLKDGKVAGALPTPTLISQDTLYSGALQANSLKINSNLDPNKPQAAIPLTQLWQENLNITPQFLSKNRLYGSNENKIFAYDLPEFNAEIKSPKLIWQLEVNGTIAELIAADNKIFGVTFEGNLFCLTATSDNKTYPQTLKEAVQPLEETSVTREDSIMRTTGIREGYAIVLGAGTGMLAEQLARKSKLNVIVVEPDLTLVTKLRFKWDTNGIYGTRIAILHGEPFEFKFPPYIASLVVSENIDFEKYKVLQVVNSIFHTLRPYGGTACLKVPANIRDKWTAAIYENKLRMAANRNKNDWTLLIRDGQMLGAGEWSHQYGDATNSVVSNDSLVKMPLGLLWFGSATNKNVLSRYGHGPNPQVAGGRVVTQGPGHLQAYDAYTGRMLWELQIVDLGKAFESDTRQPGASSIGSNYVTLFDYIYVVFRGACLKIESETGAVADTFFLPLQDGQTAPPKWGFIATSGDFLIATAEPINADDKEQPGKFTWNGTSSKAIYVLNRHTGKVLWQKNAEHGFRHNAIAVGNEMVFCIDFVPPEIKALLEPEKAEYKGRIYAFDLKNGRQIWNSDKGVFGTWLGYSAEHDVLIQAGRPSRDMLTSEPKNRINAYQGKDGTLLWDKPIGFSGPCLINDKDILTQNAGYNLFTGAGKTKKDPITNDIVNWNFAKNYGCTTAVASKNLLVFRSTTAAYFDLTNNGGTGNFGGFRLSCTSNMIIADGIVSVPDYTRPCTCSYQNQTSLALVHNPVIETWTFTNSKWNKRPIQMLGINLGAPGDYTTESGCLWVEFPVVGGPSQDIPIKITPENSVPFRQHSSLLQNSEFSFVGASGVKGIQTLTIPTGNADNIETYYTVKLIFCEFDEIKLGERVMDIAIQDKIFLENFDIIKETKESKKITVKEFKGIKSGKEIKIELKLNSKSIKKETILNGVELILER